MTSYGWQNKLLTLLSQQEICLFQIKIREASKNLKTSRVRYLDLEPSIFIKFFLNFCDPVPL